MVMALPSQSVHKKVLARAQDSVACDACKFSVDKLESELELNSTVQELIAYADKACQYIPNNLTEEGDALVAQYMLPAIQALVNKATPDLVCSFVGLCTKSRIAVTGIECALCEAAVARAEVKLESNTTVAELTQWLDELCDKAPAGYKGVCDNLVATYLSKIIDLLVADLPPTTVCTDLQLC